MPEQVTNMYDISTESNLKFRSYGIHCHPKDAITKRQATHVILVN